MKLLLALLLSFASAQEMPSPDLNLVDVKTSPCTDFYQYACGGWMKKAKIPADRSSWSRGFAQIDDQNEKVLRSILESYAKGKFEPANPYAQQMGNLYASCMDESKLEKGSLATLNSFIERVDRMTPATLKSDLSWLHQHDVSVLFNFGSGQDMKNPEEVIAEMDQGGMGLPTRDYYLDQSARMKEIRGKYVQHIERMLKLAGQKNAALQAEQILKLETKLAESALSPVERRDVTKLYHRMNQEGLSQLLPQVKWDEFFQAMQIKVPAVFNVSSPQYFKRVSEVVAATPMDELKNYLRFRLIARSAQGLPNRFYDEAFAFYGKELTGRKSAPVRWKRCVSAVDDLMGFALSRSYVALKFAGKSQETAHAMIEQVMKAQRELLEQVPWMDEKTRKTALQKLTLLTPQVGYPSKWRSYDGLEIKRDSYLANRFAGNAFNTHYEMLKIGQPLDRTEWSMVPSEVNAYYDPQMAKMVFPAGILQPPFFHASYSSAANFGGIGMVMGHEISHGFDDQGRQFDGKGAMLDWWSETSSTEFQKRTQCLIEQYDRYPTAGGTHVNGQLTLGENIGDQGGIKISYLAWKNNLGAPATADQEKEFFTSYAQSWCTKTTDKAEQLQVSVDPHPPARHRVNGAVSNFKAFADAFQCSAGAPMAPQTQCVVW